MKDFEDVKGIVKGGHGILTSSNGGLGLDSSKNTIFNEEQKAEGLKVLTAAFEQANNEIADIFSVRHSDERIDEIKKYNITENEIKFIKSVQPNKVFYLKKIPSMAFVKLSSGKFINAETYVLRLEKGLIDLNSKYEKQVSVYKNQQEYLERVEQTALKFENMTPFELIKLGLNKLLRRA